MATRISSIESHPQREEIIKALAAEQPFRVIEAWTKPPVTIATLSRFKRHSMAKLLSSVSAAKAAIANTDTNLERTATQSVTRAALTVAVDPFLSHVMRSSARRERWIEAAEKAPGGPDHRALAAHDRNDLTALELHAKLAGRLDAQPTSVTNNYIVMPTTAPAPAPHLLDAGDVSFDDSK